MVVDVGERMGQQVQDFEGTICLNIDFMSDLSGILAFNVADICICSTVLKISAFPADGRSPWL